jgi:NAD(P) transhydrogenase subunit alpha
MRVTIPKETKAGERRVAGTPDTVKRLLQLGFEVAVQPGAGVEAGYPDPMYVAAGAVLTDDPWSTPGIVTKVDPPSEAEVDRAVSGIVLVSLLYPAQAEALVQRIAGRGLTALALDRIPRISRAQKMDVLSSMANIAGYRAVLEAANVFPRFFGGQITAAGKTPPARVLVIGAGVAGLAAIGAARGLGAEVVAFDTRRAVKEQVESMGGRFLTVELEESGEGQGGYAKEMSKAFLDAEMALFREQAPRADIVITTALVPGRRAPLLWTKDMVELQQPGSVVVDLAASQGGNCEVTVPGRIHEHHGVSIVGYTDLTSRLPGHASQMFARNVAHLLEEMGGGAGFHVDRNNEVVRSALIVDNGEIVPAPPPPEPSPPPKPAPAPVVKAARGHREARQLSGTAVAGVGVGSAVLLGIVGQLAPAEFIQHLTVFVLAVFVGWQVVWNVTPALHTPLMSVTNAISGIILVGGMLQAGSGSFDAAAVLGTIAILLAAINVFGGFLVTQRMLQMFRK